MSSLNSTHQAQTTSSGVVSAVAPGISNPAVRRDTVGLTRLSDYVEIAKPRISLMVLLTVTVGYFLALEHAPNLAVLVASWIGIGTVAMGSSALNQWFERHTDLHMSRTRNRPLPSGRLSSNEVLLLGICCGLFGFVSLAIFVNWSTVLLTALTLGLYVGAYTPLKRLTSLCTAVGAIPGALPPVLGWLAAGGEFGAACWSLFGLLFLWQFPHFLAIAWLYRDEYESAGLRMLPARGAIPHVTGLLAVCYSLCLIPVSMLPSWFGLAGIPYSSAALVLGLIYFVASVQFACDENRESARRLLWVSLVYLPLMLIVLTWDHFRLLGWLPGT